MKVAGHGERFVSRHGDTRGTLRRHGIKKLCTLDRDFSKYPFLKVNRQMKTAISIPDDIYQTAELLARQRHVSRSALFTNAISEFIQRHRQDDVTERLNKVYSRNPAALDPALQKMQSASIPKEQW